MFSGLIASGSDDEEEEATTKSANILLSAANLDANPSVFSKRATMTDDNEEDDKPLDDDDEPKKPKTSSKKKRSTKAKLAEKIGAKKKRKLADLATQLPADVDDSRFTALYDNSEFAIDKTHPSYRGGILADRQVHEKIRRKKTKE